jgi:hypothetical protein
LTNAPSNEKEDESLQNVVFIFFFIHYILCLYMRLFSLINSPIFFQNRFLFCAVEYGFVNDFLIKLYFKATVIYLVFTHALFHKKGAYLVSLKRPIAEDPNRTFILSAGYKKDRRISCLNEHPGNRCT